MIGLPGISNSQDTLICDNGGFEDEFIYYRGYYGGPFKWGSNTCTPLYANYSPIVYTEASTLPFAYANTDLTLSNTSWRVIFNLYSI